jgi:hypothetical protein
MTSLRATYDSNGTLTVSGGPVAVRCYGWVDIDQDAALGFDSTDARRHTERGHRFAGVAELEGLRVAAVEYLGAYTALVLPQGSRLIAAARLALPPLRPVPPTSPKHPALNAAPASPEAKSAARAVARAVLALVILDLFGR